MRRRAISQVVGSLFMMSVVASVGGVVLFQGLNGINAFNLDLSNSVENQKKYTSESLLIEHVKFTAGDDDFTIWIRNTGPVDITIETIKVTNISAQTLVVDKDDLNWSISTKNLDSQTYAGSLGSSTWNSFTTNEFKISVTTQAGNSFTTVAQPFNT